MLKVQIALIAILIASVAFVSCERAEQMLEPVVVEDMRTDMKKILDAGTYTSWAHVTLPAPVPMAESTTPIETGAAHNPAHATTGVTTSRTVYINEIGAIANKVGTAYTAALSATSVGTGAMANKAGTAYPAGTIIFKAIMDDTETFVDKVAMMMKSDDEMYAGHGGWRYEKYARPSEDGEYMQVRGSNLEDAGNGCHGCHAQADTDSVFVALPMDTDMPEAAASDHSDGHGDGHGHTGDGDTGDAGHGDAGPDADEEAASIANDDVQ